MRVTTRDPMSGHEVANPNQAPYVLEGNGANALKIYFESVQSRQDYLTYAAESVDRKSVNAYNQIANDETMGTIN